MLITKKSISLRSARNDIFNLFKHKRLRIETNKNKGDFAMMIKKDITTIEKGIIMHQVNCQNVMGAGVAKVLYTKYPKIKAAFHQMAETAAYNTPKKRFGLVQPITITPELIVLNSYSQLYFGRNKNIKYTDESKLITNLQKLDNYAKEKNLPAYVPERIGCGLANGD